MSDKITQLLSGEWAHLKTIVNESVVENRNWYRRMARVPMLLFRGLGGLVILISFGISALSFWSRKGAEGPDFTAAIFVMSLFISAITAYMSFFQLQSVWRSRRQAEINLSNILILWQLDLLEAAEEPDSKLRLEKALKITRRCVESAAALTGAETNEFFSGMSTAKDVVSATSGKPSGE